VQLAARVDPLEVSDVVGHKNHAVVDGIAGDMLVRRSPKIDLVDMNCWETATPCKANERGAQVLVNEELELAGPKAGLLAKAEPFWSSRA
jgi:hypothetical protein